MLSDRSLLVSCFFVLALTSVWAQTPALLLSTPRPGHLFPADTAPVVAVKALAPVTWRLLGFDGEQLEAGTLTPQEGTAQLMLPVLPHGYYELLAQSGAERARFTFGMIADKSAQAPTAGRLNTDTAAAWLVKPEQFEELALMLRALGMGWARERFSWGGTEPEPEQVNWRQYDANAEAYARAGVRVYQICHDSPDWTHAGNDKTKNPADLRDVYRFARRIGEHYRGKVAAWEVWNEPDISFWPDLSDTYAGLLKAWYLGLKAADPQIPVLLGSFCRGFCPFDEGVLEAGAKDYFDIFNWHCYSPPEAYAGTLRRYLELLDKHGCADRPVWLSECGVRVMATEPGGELNAVEERRQAEFIPCSFASSLAAGTDNHFFFVFPYYLENGVQFGALHRDLSPRPACVAMAAAVDLLGQARYLGQLPLPKTPGVKVLAFLQAQRRVLLVWADKPVTIVLPVGVSHVAISDLMGRRRTVETAGGKLELEVGPRAQYVLGVAQSLERLLSGKVRPPGKLPQTRPCPVILRGQAQLTSLDKDRDYYHIGTEQFTYTVETCNFDAQQTATGKLTLTLPAGWQAKPEAATLRLPPRGRVLSRFTVTPGQPTSEVVKLTVKPEFPGLKVAPSVSHFRLDFTQVPPRQTLDLELGEVAQWTGNISGNGTMTLSAVEGGGVRTEATFTQPGDRWCYPYVTFDPPRDFSKFQGLVFEYRCGAEGNRMTVRPQLYEPGGSAYLPDALPCRQDWTRAVIRFEDLGWGSFSPTDPNAQFDPQVIARLMLGLNTAEGKAWLEVRKLQLVAW